MPKEIINFRPILDGEDWQIFVWKFHLDEILTFPPPKVYSDTAQNSMGNSMGNPTVRHYSCSDRTCDVSALSGNV